MGANKDKNKIAELLTRGVEEVFVKEHLRKALMSGKRLRIKHGVDPTGPKIHIGRAIPLWKLRAFQDLGHKIVLIIGDFTAQIGDASDKETMRRCLTEKEIKENMKTYKEQIGKILDLKKVEFRYNSEWLGKLTAKDIIQLAMKFTAQQIIQRRNFKERWDSANPIGVHELLYPLMQGYDSKAIKADVEIGGYDQLFNLNTGRDVQRIFKQEPQDIMTLKMLFGLDGRKMSTSWGNVVNITDQPNEMFGKIMSMNDSQIMQYFELCTQTSLAELEKIKKDLDRGANPRDIKARLAKEIAAVYWGKEKAERAGQEFNKVFKEKQVPSEMPIFAANKKIYPILDLLVVAKLARSKAEARRLVSAGAVWLINGAKKTKVDDWKTEVKIEQDVVLQAGKRAFAKIKT